MRQAVSGQQSAISSQPRMKTAMAVTHDCSQILRH
jgi:hypothetical protein